MAAYEAETVPLENVIVSIDALWKAKLGAADTAPQRIAAHVQRVQYLWQLEMKIEDLFQTGERGGEANKRYRIEYCLTDAEMALIDACVADKQPYPAALARLPDRPRFDRDEAP